LPLRQLLDPFSYAFVKHFFLRDRGYRRLPPVSALNIPALIVLQEKARLLGLYAGIDAVNEIIKQFFKSRIVMMALIDSLRMC
jgi:hypothetical protein